MNTQWNIPPYAVVSDLEKHAVPGVDKAFVELSTCVVLNANGGREREAEARVEVNLRRANTPVHCPREGYFFDTGDNPSPLPREPS